MNRECLKYCLNPRVMQAIESDVIKNFALAREAYEQEANGTDKKRNLLINYIEAGQNASREFFHKRISADFQHHEVTVSFNRETTIGLSNGVVVHFDFDVKKGLYFSASKGGKGYEYNKDTWTDFKILLKN